MKIHILRTEGNCIYNNWVDGGVEEYHNKIKELENKGYELLQRVANLSEKTSTYGCMPTMEVHIIKED